MRDNYTNNKMLIREGTVLFYWTFRRTFCNHCTLNPLKYITLVVIWQEWGSRPGVTHNKTTAVRRTPVGGCCPTGHHRVRQTERRPDPAVHTHMCTHCGPTLPCALTANTHVYALQLPAKENDIFSFVRNERKCVKFSPRLPCFFFNCSLRYGDNLFSKILMKGLYCHTKKRNRKCMQDER